MFSLINDNPAFDMNDPSTIPVMYQEGYKYYSEIDPNPGSAHTARPRRPNRWPLMNGLESLPVRLA
jgi:hypothetical protein